MARLRSQAQDPNSCSPCLTEQYPSTVRRHEDVPVAKPPVGHDGAVPRLKLKLKRILPLIQVVEQNGAALHVDRHEARAPAPSFLPLDGLVLRFVRVGGGRG